MAATSLLPQGASFVSHSQIRAFGGKISRPSNETDSDWAAEVMCPCQSQSPWPGVGKGPEGSYWLSQVPGTSPVDRALLKPHLGSSSILGQFLAVLSALFPVSKAEIMTLAIFSVCEDNCVR